MTTTMAGQSRGACRMCGKQSYVTRKDARKAAKRAFPGEHMQAYECRYGGGLWHVGHAAPAVVAGILPKGTLYVVRPGDQPRKRQLGNKFRRSVVA
jgi:hypothetical protein